MPPTYTTPSGELYLSEKAFNRLCSRCDSMFESTALVLERAKRARTDEFTDDVPFGTLRDLLNSASKGDCHFCCFWAARVLVSESAHLITGQDMKPDEQVRPSLQPVVSQGVLLGTEIEPAVDTLATSTGREKALWVSRRFWTTRSGQENIYFCLNAMGEDGKLISLTSWVQNTLLPGQEEVVHWVHALPTSLNTGSEASLNQVSRWVENCVSNHPSCNMVIQENSQGKYPARFLDVGCTGSHTVKLTETTGMDFQKHRYMTLSHCWGDSVPARLLLDNYDSRLNGFALDELPRTFQDAIRLTQRLNVRFLWIDSLCIIQDSPYDWEAESAKMRFVYQNTYLNLAAAVSPNSSGGFFFPRHPLSFVPWSIRLPGRGARSTLVQHYLASDPLILHTRGWVLQEQLLPRRTLISGRQELYWECFKVCASECFPDSIPWGRAETTVFTHVALREFRRMQHFSSVRRLAWATMVTDYSGRKFTKQSDKLVAISGFAEHLSNGWDGVTYLAGLWSYRLRDNLLWRCRNVEQSKGRNTGIAPSWSWASLSATCDLRGRVISTEIMDSLAGVLEAIVSPLTPTHLFGPVLSGGMVRIRGPLLRASCTVRSTTLRPEWRCDLGEERDGMEASLPDLKLSWDETESHGSVIYLAPLQVQLYSTRSSLFLEGLFLRPSLTSPARKGTFERLGMFEMDQWIYASKQDLSSRHSIHDDRLLVKSIGRLFARLTGGSEEERMSLLRRDPYLNGPLNTKLKHRYSPELASEQYPNLAEFLDYLERAAQHNRASDSPDENLGQDEGNGFYIYELV